jgi:hypothetical protein
MASIGGSVPGIPYIRIISPWFTAGVYTAVTWGFLAPTIPKLTFYVAETNYLYTVYICLHSTLQLSDVPVVPAAMSLNILSMSRSFVLRCNFN